MRKNKTVVRIKQLIVDKIGWRSLAAVGLFVLLTLESRAVLSAMQRSLRLCAGSIIPALFPYLAASELLVSSGAGEQLARRFSAPLCTLFGISPCGAVVYVMGLLCGFPVGATTAAAYARLGKISKEELVHLLCFCNVPSTAFVVNAVGASLHGSVRVGWLLWGISIFSAAAVGVLYRLLFRRKGGEESQIVLRLDTTATVKDGNPLTRAAMGMLSVVATVLFFGALMGALRALIDRAFVADGRVWEGALALLSAFLEMSSGVTAAASLGGALSLLLCAAALGWGGLSVHYQLFSASRGLLSGADITRFYLSRVMQAALCVVGIRLCGG